MKHNLDLPYSAKENLINEWVNKERYRMIMRYRFLDGLTYEMIAEKVDMSVRQIKNIVYIETDNIKSHLDI